ncbi:MAG TPA: sigma-70 family RNA polymerase sigma factor [Kribbellaceae bacterium]|jgi:RNA polymerase sigma factor (sigma-70 family)
MSAAEEIGSRASARVVDQRADFESAYRAHYATLVRLAAMTTGSPALAEEIVQDVFIDYYRHAASVVEPVRWLRRAVVNRTVSWTRRQILERRHRGMHQEDEWHHLNPEAFAVREVLRRLKPRHRAAVFLRYYLDLPDAEIAEALGCRPATVRSLLHRGLTMMRESFRD